MTAMTGGEGGPAVIARALTKCYGGGTVALDRLDLTIEYGEFVGFLGRSGAGKTTFFRLLNGTLRPTAGELTVLGEVIGRLRGAPLRRLRRRVAIVPQAHGLIPPRSLRGSTRCRAWSATASSLPGRTSSCSSAATTAACGP